MQNARGANLPKEKVENAIKKASGADAANYQELTYEGYGNGGVAVFIETAEENWEITTSFENFGAMQKKLEELGIEVENASLQRIALNYKSLPVSEALKFLKMIEKLEEDDDINTVYHNLELTDELIKELENS